MPENVFQKIGEALLSDDAVEKLANWQQHDNDNIDGRVCDLLKAVSFIATRVEQFDDSEKQKAMQHVIALSNIAEELEVFKK